MSTIGKASYFLMIVDLGLEMTTKRYEFRAKNKDFPVIYEYKNYDIREKREKKLRTLFQIIHMILKWNWK